MIDDMAKVKTVYRIGIDCRLAGRRHAGIGRYIENLVVRLPSLVKPKSPIQFTWVLFFFDKQQQEEVTARIPESQRSTIETVLCPTRHYTIREQLQMPRVFKQAKLDLLHVPHFNVPLGYSSPYVVTIHDLLWHERTGAAVTTLPAWQYWLKYFGYRLITTQAVSHARAILVPTNTVREVLAKHYPQSKNKIVVTHEGVETQFILNGRQSSPKKTVKAAYPLLLYVGSLYPHKNIHVVIQALKKLPRYRLTLVGARNVFVDKVKRFVHSHDLGDRVTFAGYVPDNELKQLYAQATALVQPSLSEGFGLTGVEAMAAGVPVIASDIPVFREIYQKAARYFDPNSIDDFVKTVKNLEKTSRSALIQQGKALAATYNWDTMTEQTFDLYAQTLGIAGSTK